jgi:pimeloyl-ACP methyl ester carboxylesterase
VTGAGPPVVLIHGLGLDHRMWERKIPALAAAGHRVITCDLPGHGAGRRPTRAGSVYTTEELAASLVEALEESSVDPATLVGFSLGGGIALQIALDRPERVSALALVDTTAWPGPDAVARFAGRAAAVEAEGVGVLVHPAIERWFTPEFVAAQDEIRAPLRRVDRGERRHRLRGRLPLPRRARPQGSARRDPLPHAGCGRRPRRGHAHLNGGSAGGRHCRGHAPHPRPAGHLVTEERWAELNATLLEFLARAGRAARRA